MKTKCGAHAGSAWGEVDTIVEVLEIPGRKDRAGVGILTPKCEYRAYVLGIACGIETKCGAHEGSAWGDVDMIVEVLRCQEEKIERGWVY